MTDGAFYSKFTVFHQSADRPKYKRQKVLKTKFPHEEAILTIDGEFYSENLLLSKHRSTDRQNFVLGTQKRQKRHVRSFCNEI
jgi:hypothetical protein